MEIGILEEKVRCVSDVFALFCHVNMCIVLGVIVQVFGLFGLILDIE